MHGMARTLQDLNRLDEAIAVAKRIAELDPDDVLAYTSLSVLYQKKGMIPEAEAEANKAQDSGMEAAVEEELASAVSSAIMASSSELLRS